MPKVVTSCADIGFIYNRAVTFLYRVTARFGYFDESFRQMVLSNTDLKRGKKCRHDLTKGGRACIIKRPPDGGREGDATKTVGGSATSSERG